MSLSLKDVVLRVGADTHVHPTHLDLAPNGFNVLLGPTLAGKTTLLRIMAGLLVPTAGEVWFAGRDVTRVPVRRRDVAMVYQQFINYPHLSVFENIASPLAVLRLPSAEIRSRVGRIAELLGLSALLDRRPDELSGGQQQRTALARALVKDARLVLLDEPLANLDYKLREGLRDELPRLLAGRDCTVVYATTEPAEALLLGGHTAVIHEGRVVQFGPTSEVYRRPANVTSASAFSDPPMNTVPVKKVGDRFELGSLARWQASDALASLPDGEYTFGLRPHNVLPEAVGGARGGVAVRGAVSIAEISGSESVIHFALDDRPWVSQSHGVHRFAVGEQIAFRLDVARGHYFDAAGRCVHSSGA